MTSNGKPDRVELAAVILTKNAAKHIVDCIETLRFADRIVVSDSYSTDGTAELAQSAGAEVIQRPFDNFAGQRNASLEAVDAEDLVVDVEERITLLLATEVREVLSREENWWVHDTTSSLEQVRYGGFTRITSFVAAPRSCPLRSATPRPRSGYPGRQVRPSERVDVPLQLDDWGHPRQAAAL